ncbi:hypothetical protein BH24BAC1_BH24BAC1_11240 [soil metagenome]
MNKIFKKTYLWLVLVAALVQTPSFGRPGQESLANPVPATATVEKTNPGTPPSRFGVRDIISEITATVGLKPKFEIVSSSRVPNAAAVIMNGKRYVLYNERFVAAVNNAVKTDWAGISILAHEIGHHLNGHTLDRGGSNPADELEADEFSGFVLRKMGASVEEAVAAMRLISDEEGSSTHPGRSPRLAAITKGWNDANALILVSAKPGSGLRPHQPQQAPEPMVARSTSPSPERREQASRVQESILGKLTFQSSPEENIFVTSGMKLVRVSDNGTAQVVGKVSRSNNERFPFILQSDYFHSLLVSRSGAVVNRQGYKVGSISEV